MEIFITLLIDFLIIFFVSSIIIILISNDKLYTEKNIKDEINKYEYLIKLNFRKITKYEKKLKILKYELFNCFDEQDIEFIEKSPTKIEETKIEN